jgi:hypothetical protein
MQHQKSVLANLLKEVDLGSSVAETDSLLQDARVETSVFSDLLADRVDLVPGTKGSGKSALYRIFVDFLPGFLVQQRRVVIAHGVQSHGDSVFHAFGDQFNRLSEADFVDFWCIYLISLAHEHFIKDPKYATLLSGCSKEIEAFKRACQAARIPEIQAKKSLLEILAWALEAVGRRVKPKLTYNPDTNETSFELFSPAPDESSKDERKNAQLPKYVAAVQEALHQVLIKADLWLWLMVDRLDEVFPRRSKTETKALRGLLRTLQTLSSDRIRIKIFLRDDILGQIVGSHGFTALTHITARSANQLSWSEDQILSLVVKRLAASPPLRNYLNIDQQQLGNRAYQEQLFYRVFPETVHSGPNQSRTLRWIYTHTMDGRNVVTPRDVIDLLTRAKQRQQDEFEADQGGVSDWIIGPSAILYGHTELSKRKKDTYLKAEFSHFWSHIEKFVKGKTEYSEAALRKILGTTFESAIGDLTGIGLLTETKANGNRTFKIPFLYREGLELTQGKVE